MIKKIKPCDCIDQYTAKQLNEQGIKINENSLQVEPNVVILTIGHTTIKIPMQIFKKMSEWYLKEQTIKFQIYTDSNNLFC